MEPIFALFLLVVALWLLIGPIIALSMAADAKRRADAAKQQARDLTERVVALELEVDKLRSAHIRQMIEEAQSTALAPESEPAAVIPVRVATPPPLRSAPLVTPLEERLVVSAAAKKEMPVEHGEESVRTEVAEEAMPVEPFSLERFMGVKLFAWLGGIAVFFGVIFFVKYAFENNLISARQRVALGFVTGTALLAGGWWTHRLEKYRVLGQVFCATGVVILYGVSFAAHAIYRFPAFGVVQTMVLMGVITVIAFLTAVRLNALVVAVLGMLGGFMAPILVSTGRDEVFGLFGYIALLDIGLLAVSMHRRWRPLAAAAALGTVIMQIGWAHRFFVEGRYYEGDRIFIPMGFLLLFIGLFKSGCWFARKRRDLAPWAEGSVLGLAAVAMVFAFGLLGFGEVAERHFLLYGFILTIQLSVSAVVFLRPTWVAAQVIAGLAVFVHLAVWSSHRLTNETLIPALVLYLVFGVVGSLAPVLLAKRLPADIGEGHLVVGHWFAPLTLLMMLVPLLVCDHPPLPMWVAVLMANILSMVLAFQSRRIVPVLVSVVLTMGLAWVWIATMPGQINQLMPILGVICGFSLVFAVAGKWLLSGIDSRDSGGLQTEYFLVIPAAVLPYGLLVVLLQRLAIMDPSPVFGAAVLMSALLVGLAVVRKNGLLLPVALICTTVVEAVWHCHYFRAETPWPALGWYLATAIAFLVLPFLFRRCFRDEPFAWVGSALAGVVHFPLVHHLVTVSYPSEVEGLIPAAFAVPSLLALAATLRSPLSADPGNRSRIAWFGGVALLFLTLIFPIQFERQWITLGWALEGAALLWLFRRVPHPGLQSTGLTLLSVSFARLACNPAVFIHYERSGTAVFNWHLYVYGVAAAAMFAGAFWFSDPAGRWRDKPAPRPLLNAMGGILLFLLLNIEIADYFTLPGDRCVAFDFGGNFARDMTYSIAWGIFALVLLVLGIWKRSRRARYAALGLLGVTVAKVLIHDMAASQTVFRVGALLGVGVIAFAASWLYQRFFDRTDG